MKRFVWASAVALAAISGCAASAADLPYRSRERVYERPIPRVYYQSARPTAVCRVAFLREGHGRHWPKEQRSVARCTSFE